MTNEPRLAERLRELAINCWQTFGLQGYARVDMRIDDADQPWILEINANPCLSPDAGFYAACSAAGLTSIEIVRRLVSSFNRVPSGPRAPA
jgi:D-alanine-D-alanine ligase